MVILGRPNVGKSTLLNRLVGSKVAIVTPKPQTTRNAIQGVVTRPEGQIVFVDSPGIHEPSLELGNRMMSEVHRATSGCHLVLLVVDATIAAQAGDVAVIQMVRDLGKPVMLLLNKIDLLKSKDELLPQIEEYRKRYEFAEYVPISARLGDGVEALFQLSFDRLPLSPSYYPDDYLTDQPERFMAAEMIREQIIFATHREVPHATAVIVDEWDDEEDLLRIFATIYVERQGQKAILIGAHGGKLKEIGTKARKQLEAFFGKKVFVQTFVKVHPHWRDRRGFVQSLDFHNLVGMEIPELPDNFSDAPEMDSDMDSNAGGELGTDLKQDPAGAE